jgi:beta-glucosidase/6-phospho-beta-glucosidase/beta-galactosidase
MDAFMFATGIENSYPTIAGGRRVDEMEKCGHYDRWREDLELTARMNIRFLRWGPAIHRTWLGRGQYDWGWVDEVVTEMDRLDIEPIMDLCHFGLPDWLGNFQSRLFPELFAEYAQAFAARYPHVRYWTPVNEILITAMFSAKYGWWNERLASEESFTRATLNLCRANMLGMHAIHTEAPHATFVQSESIEYFHPANPSLIDIAAFENERRFLPLDFSYGCPVSDRMYSHLRRHGMQEREYQFFMDANDNFDCILGTDYYITNEHLVKPNGTTGPSGEYYGYYVLAREYYERYGIPLMHTETNLRQDQDSVQWLRKQWNSLLRLRQDGIPVLGFTWYSLTDQKDWDTALREDAHNVNAVGLFDLERRMRPVGEEYANIIEDWASLLPAEAVHESHVNAPQLAA